MAGLCEKKYSSLANKPSILVLLNPLE
jgi:hypothetical protein